MIDTDTNTKPNYLRSLIEWLQQVAADPKLPPMATRVANILSRYVNTRSFEAWPSVQTLAQKLGATDRGVQKAVAALVAGGHLQVTVGGGRTNSNRYVPLLKTPNAGSGFKADETPNRRSEKGEQNGQKTPNGCSPELVEDSIDISIEPLAAKAAAKGGGRDEPLGGGSGPQPAPPPIKAEGKKAVDRATAEALFQAFWQPLPKKQGIDGARKAFKAAIDGGADPQAIIAAAERLGAEWADRPARYAPSPKHWLLDGCWKDPPSPPAPHEPAPVKPRRADKAQAISNIFAMAARLKSEGR
jgi:hypothetical protein